MNGAYIAIGGAFIAIGYAASAPVNLNAETSQ